jgi:hypothetical protein
MLTLAALILVLHSDAPEPPDSVMARCYAKQHVVDFQKVDDFLNRECQYAELLRLSNRKP